MWKVRCGKLGTLLRELVASEQGEKGQVLAGCVWGPFPWTFTALTGLPQITVTAELLAAVCRLRGSLVCFSLLAFPTGDKPDRCDLGLESNLNTWF